MPRNVADILADIKRADDDIKHARAEIYGVEDLDNPTEADLERSDRSLETVQTVTDRMHALKSELTAAVDAGMEIYTERAGNHTGSEVRRSDPAGQLQGRALATVERNARHTGDDAAQSVTCSLERGGADRTGLAEFITRTGSDAYFAAFCKLLRDPERGHLEFTGQELAAFREVRQIQRAMSLGTNSAGGFLVPYQLDPQIRLTGSGSVNPIRKLATVHQTTQNVLKVVTSAGMTASWDAEAAEVSDDSPTLSQPSITAFKGNVFLPASYELLEDSDISQQVGMLMADAKDQLEATAFTTGTGSGEPEGVITGAVAASTIVTSAGSALAIADVQSLIAAVAPRFRPGASFMANLLILNQARVLPRYANGPALLGDDGTVFGWRAYENSAMDGTIAAGTTNDYVLLAGDFRRGYEITDRLGATVELVPHLFGASGRPTGQRGYQMHWRTGGKVTVPQAFALLNYNG